HAPDVGGIRAGVGLAKGKSAEQLATRHAWHPAPALRIIAEAVDQASDHIVHGEPDARGHVGATDLFVDERTSETGHLRAAQLLGDKQASKSHLGQWREDLAREVVLLIPALGI